MPGPAVRNDVTPFICHLTRTELALESKYRRKPHALVAVSTKYGNNPFASTKPNAGAITLLWRLCTSPATLLDEPGGKTSRG